MYFKINFTKIFVKMISSREKNIRSDKIEPRKYIRLFFSVKTAIHHKNITQEAARWGSFLAKFWVFLSYFTTDPSLIGGGPLQWQPMSEPHYGDENFGSKITGSQDDFLKLLFRLLSVSSQILFLCRASDHSRGSISPKWKDF